MQSYSGLVEKPEGKRALGIPRRRGEDNIKIDLQEIGEGVVDLVWLRIGTIEGSCERGNETSISIKCGVFLH